MSEIVYVIYDVRDGKSETDDNIVALVDNDEDFVRFLMLHKDEYPIKEGCTETLESIWEKLALGGDGPDAFAECFDGIAVSKLHVNVDYSLDPNFTSKEINYLAKRVGIGHLAEPVRCES